MGNYIDYEYLTCYKLPGGITADLSAYTEDEVNDLISKYEELVETYTNDIFYQKTETKYFDGTGKYYLYLFPLVAYKLISTTSVVDLHDDGVTEYYSYEEDVDYKLYPHHLELLHDFDTKRNFITRGGGWPKGQLNIKIVGVWGWETTPKEIKDAVAQLVLKEVDPQSINLTSVNGVQRAEWDDFEIEFTHASANSNKSTTGYLEIDRILNRYLNWNLPFSTI